MASRVTLTQPGRIIFGLMTATMIFALIGGEVEAGSAVVPGPGQVGFGAATGKVNQATGTAVGSRTVSPFKIIFGGTVATSLLILISHAGEAGEEFGVGLATVAFVTAALVYGAPVWAAANAQFGSKPTAGTPASSPTAPTATTAATAAAFASAA